MESNSYASGAVTPCVPLSASRAQRNDDPFEAEALIGDSSSNSTSTFLSDEGWRYPGWWTVLGILIYNVFVWGVSDSWGVFQVLYVKVYAGQANEFLIALVGTSVLSIAYGMSVVALPVIQRFGYRLSVATSSVIVCSGLLLASTAQTVSAVFATQGLLLGVGIGLGYTAITALPSQWFVQRRSLANGLALSGTAIGSVCFAPIIQASIAAYGYRATLGGLGMAGSAVLALSTCMISSNPLLLSPPPPTLPSSSSETDITVRETPIKPKDQDENDDDYCGSDNDDENIQCLELVRGNRAFRFYILFCIVVPFGILPQWYVAPMYAVEIGASPQMGAYCVSAMGAASAISRVLFGHLADRCGVINILILGIWSAGLLSLILWPMAKTPTVFMVYCILFGFTSGVHVGLRPSALAAILGIDRVQQGISYAFPVSIIGALLGAPVVGALHQRFGWEVAIKMCGSFGTVAALLLVIVRSSLTNKIWVAV